MSTLDVNDSEVGQGGGSEDSSSSNDEVNGLRAALQAERDKRHGFETRVAELTGKVDALSQKQTTPERTRAELQALVDDGRMSQADADRILDEQRERKITDSVSQKIETSITQGRVTERVNGEIAEYTRVYPDILQDGTENRRLVAEEYQRQLTFGKPDNAQTELDALMTVFGPSSRLQRGREKELETHQDVGSDGRAQTKATGGWPKEMPDATKRYYQDLINKNIYPDRQAAVDEWSYQPKNRR